MDPSRVVAVGAALVAIALVVGGCASSEEAMERDTLTANVGVYSPPPPGIAKARLGVPPFQASEVGGNEDRVGQLAADQLTTLAFQSGRFDVIERAQLEQLLREQNLEGIVKAEELAKAGQVRGVDYLMYGKVTNLRVKSEKASRGFSIGSILSFFGIGGGVFDYKNKSEKIVTECGVDLRMVNPTSGKVDAAHFGEFKRVDTIGAFGIEILGIGAEADANLEISEDDKGKLLRVVLDEAFRKMLPSIDSVLLARAREAAAAAAPAAPPAAPPAAAPAAVAPAPAAPAAQPPAAAPAAAPKFCGSCGAKLEAGAKFCGSCGAKIGP